MLERLTGIRYVAPLREGGSLPAIVETDRGGPFVVKFRGAGQGPRALIAEALAADLGLALDLPVPAPALVELEAGFGRAEPDPEIQDILRGSTGPNFGLAFLPSALAFDPAVDHDVAPELAADVVWFDALITNVDRTARNTNILYSGDRLWLIDHGASFYFHHQWQGWESRIDNPFPLIREHVLLHLAGDLLAADARLRSRLSDDVLTQVVAALPDEWLALGSPFADLAEHRAAYVAFLRGRLSGPRAWLREAVAAQARGPILLAPRETTAPQFLNSADDPRPALEGADSKPPGPSDPPDRVV